MDEPAGSPQLAGYLFSGLGFVLGVTEDDQGRTSGTETMLKKADQGRKVDQGSYDAQISNWSSDTNPRRKQGTLQVVG